MDIQFYFCQIFLRPIYEIICGVVTSEHKTEIVRYGDHDVNIDCMIVPLIKKILEHGFHTSNSCENNPNGYIWIQFINTKNLLKFMQIIYNGTEGIRNKWRMNLSPVACNDDSGKCTVAGFRASLRFPVEDLPYVMQRLG